MTGLQRERMSSVDTAWLRMDRPGNLMTICGVLVLSEPVGFARVKRLIRDRFARFRRFRQRPVQAPGAAYWEDVPRFCVEDHVRTLALPGRAGTRELRALVSRLVSRPLDPARPLWEFCLVERFDRGSALIMRVHHCYADGIALVRVMMSMTDAAPKGPPAMPFEAVSRRRRSHHSGDPLAELFEPFSGAMRMARSVGSTLLEKGAAIWQDPGRALALAEQGGTLAAELARLALMPQDSPTRFKGKPGAAKRVAWAEPLSLEEVRTVARALGASINDVLLSCVAGALRRYLARKGDPTDGVMIRALVPVNLRPPETACRLGNRFGIVFLDLPIGIENPVERLYAVRATMSALKGSCQPVIALGLLAAMGAAPKMLEEQLLLALSRNGTAVMTNVPGPPQPLYFARAKIERFLFWVPQSGDIGMGVSILSYAGQVQFGLITDRGLCPDPEHVIEEFGPEFEVLLLTTLLAPWPRSGDLDPAVAAEAVGYSSSERASSTSRRSIASAGLNAAASR